MASQKENQTFQAIPLLAKQMSIKTINLLLSLLNLQLLQLALPQKIRRSLTSSHQRRTVQNLTLLALLPLLRVLKKLIHLLLQTLNMLKPCPQLKLPIQAITKKQRIQSIPRKHLLLLLKLVKTRMQRTQLIPQTLAMTRKLRPQMKPAPQLLLTTRLKLLSLQSLQLQRLLKFTTRLCHVTLMLNRMRLYLQMIMKDRSVLQALVVLEA